MAGSHIIILVFATFSACLASPVPLSNWIAIENVTFQLYTVNNPDGSRVVIDDPGTLDAAGFDSGVPTKIIVHGWMDDLDSGVVRDLKREFLKLEPMNVFGVGWPLCSRNVLYEQATECAQLVGMYVGQLVTMLQTNAGVSPSDIHAIGHSLGAEAVSFVSRVVKLGHITALDAAAPLYSHADPMYRLDPDDADFVDVFHTSTKLVGMKNPIGHIDFYPNGGAEQPGCVGIFGACAHSAAYAFYAHTISEATRNEYLAYKCDTIEDAKNMTCMGEPRAVMGYGASIQNAGVYYLNITEVPW